MQDIWKYIAFALAAVSGSLSSSIASTLVTQSNALPEGPGTFAVIGGIGLATGFLIDELIPVYIEKVRNSGGGGAGAADIGGGGGGGDDFDFDE